ncbi:molybdopterin molybdotransferase MoeA [Corynebacterium sp.]|uniref:molybdopterin molybdotransferase MoeA n=1 Tax=Corynebacterium sp. TaxID=1720 RepID=UPI002A920672|nr:molybdopterin molybdotransferase MoeA [Corynebacterium sp.]MDY5786262.1 molybdopterin molybdotransferase MoeA [Corynebacterium sp.]
MAVSIAEHRSRVLALAAPRILRGVPLDAASGCVLATDVVGAYPVPPFDNSAMDGFVVHVASLSGPGPWTLPVAGDIPAGVPAAPCPPGHAVRIMTGAPLPAGEGLTVIPVEDTDIPPGPVPLPDCVTITRWDPARTHIRPAGANLAAGSVVAAAGTLIDAGTLAALVSTGVTAVDAFAPPRVAVVSTGDELVAWPTAPGPGQLPDSNLPMIAALARANGAGDVVELRTDDNNASFADVLDAAAQDADIVVTTGGISEGAYDVVRATTEPGGLVWFGRVHQRPGAHQGAGCWRDTALVCLPGNPVAAWVSFHLYVAPLIATAAGITDDPLRVTARAGAGFRPPRRAVPQIVPVRYSGGVATPFSAGAHISADVSALTAVRGYTILDGPDVPDILDVYLTHS